jgi:hypothetical protein
MAGLRHEVATWVGIAASSFGLFACTAAAPRDPREEVVVTSEPSQMPRDLNWDFSKQAPRTVETGRAAPGGGAAAGEAARAAPEAAGDAPLVEDPYAG